MIESIALKIAEGIKQRVPDHPASIARMKYSLAVLINTIAIITLTILISLFTYRTSEVITILIGFAALRLISGGIHLRTGTACVLVTTSLFTLLSLVHMNTHFVIALTAMSVILALLFAPSRIEQQSRIPKEYYRHLKVASALLIFTNFLVLSDTVAVCFFVQSLTLIRRKEVKQHGKVDEI